MLPLSPSEEPSFTGEILTDIADGDIELGSLHEPNSEGECIVSIIAKQTLPQFALDISPRERRSGTDLS